MNTNLKKNLQDLIDEYKANKIIFWAEFKQTLGGFNKEEVRNRYTPVGLSEVVQEANGKMVADLNATCVVYNQSAKALVESAKKSIMPALLGQSNHPADYAARVSNALNFLDRETAESLTDDVTYSILKDFTGDFEQMKLFKRIVESKVGPMVVQDGNTTFPKTFGEYAKADHLIQVFGEIDSIVENIFTHPKNNYGEGAVVAGVYYSAPDDSYTELANWATLLGLADIVDQAVPGNNA